MAKLRNETNSLFKQPQPWPQGVSGTGGEAEKKSTFVSSAAFPHKKKQKCFVLELRQYKNDSIQSKIIPTLKLPRFFHHLDGEGKERQFQNWNLF